MSESRIEINEERFPLVFITQYGVIDDVSATVNLGFYKRMLIRGTDFAVVYDGRHAERPPSEISKRFTTYLDENKDALKEHCRGVGYVLDSVLQRMALRSFYFLFSKPPWPYAAFSELEPAEQWCRKQLGL